MYELTRVMPPDMFAFCIAEKAREYNLALKRLVEMGMDPVVYDHSDANAVDLGRDEKEEREEPGGKAKRVGELTGSVAPMGFFLLSQEREDDDDLDDFRAPPSSSLSAASNGAVDLQSQATYSQAQNGMEENSLGQGPPVREGKPREMKVPKIYFGTRTHKQITQLVRELRKTAYRNVRMTVLASREHSCIHPQVSRMKNKTEGCKDVLEGKTDFGCRYKQGVSRMNTHMELLNQGLTEGWDMEDLVGMGRSLHACPYFASRDLMDNAQIVFCPYNYLLDPIIRNTMNIKLKGQILILDEAHNMEDASREAVSFTIQYNTLNEAKDDLFNLADCSTITSKASHAEMGRMLSGIGTWMGRERQDLKDTGTYGQQGNVWSGTEFLAQMENIGCGPSSHQHLLEAFWEVVREFGNAEENQERKDKNPDTPKLKTSTLTLLEVWFQVMQFLLTDGMVFKDDYKVALLEVVSGRRKAPTASAGGWYAAGGEYTMESQLTLHFWCMHPGVAFQVLKKELRSIILTSGTLSPMNSFESELATPFQIHLEASHVIDSSQVWVGTVSVGPSRVTLNASYQHAETFQFQDELGQVVLSVCRTIPHGVLAFFPSYHLMEKLAVRWKSTGLWDQLTELKEMMMEPRSGEEFHGIWKAYRDAICEGHRGALLMAVCRGKVSEGLDFADDSARAVIAVGIPFMNVKDMVVGLKKEYNNRHQGDGKRKLLTGNQWYEIQAFRALNQALGRCIRHRHDWGALVLVEERFQRFPTYVQKLSRWIRGRVAHHRDFSSAMDSLAAFTQQRLSVVCSESSSVREEPRPPLVPLQVSAEELDEDERDRNGKRRRGSSSCSSAQMGKPKKIQYLDDEEDEGHEAFLEEYGTELNARCPGRAIEDILAQVEREVTRRKKLLEETPERRSLIRRSYTPLHPHLYSLSEDFLTEEFRRLVDLCHTHKGERKEVLKEIPRTSLVGQDVYSISVFQKSFCTQFLEEMNHFKSSGLPVERPNSMNNYGVLLGDLGWDVGFLDPLRERYINPVSRLLFPTSGGGSLDSQRGFIVSYDAAKGDVDLAYHYDNAEVTLNICLNEEFEGGHLYFGATKSDVSSPKSDFKNVFGYEHKLGHGVLHLGSHLHGALPIESGERHNLVIWFRASVVRNQVCPMCHEPPDVVPVVEGYGDGFTLHSQGCLEEDEEEQRLQDAKHTGATPPPIPLSSCSIS
ncbi:unnamed protein product [Darwinula stevensoni]|uniref:DNA 5'-3' helicase n=1 Tax=Darwinula stevensoni TaxID=69355 RepID=A0A7R9A8F4_9CRUS|nr:unnamed protein product [Darwinula stevensoni]CAG0896403.1 unnamed protein product [Darwinula stevensoni]